MLLCLFRIFMKQTLQARVEHLNFFKKESFSQYKVCTLYLFEVPQLSSTISTCKIFPVLLIIYLGKNKGELFRLKSWSFIFQIFNSLCDFVIKFLNSMTLDEATDKRTDGCSRPLCIYTQIPLKFQPIQKRQKHENKNFPKK